MSKEFLGDRRAALEEAFFAKKDRELLQRLRELDQARQTKEGLSAASGITDESVLEKLAALNIDSDTLAALAVVPLVAVAWADGSISDSERRSAFSKAAEMGLSKQDMSHRLFEQWLAEPPPPELLALWKGYVKALGESKHVLKQGVLPRARAVAEAAGGFLAIGGKVSPAEERVLKELEQAFSE
jgi:DnaJ-domain-containing protein 1